MASESKKAIATRIALLVLLVVEQLSLALALSKYELLGCLCLGLIAVLAVYLQRQYQRMHADTKQLKAKLTSLWKPIGISWLTLFGGELLFGSLLMATHTQTSANQQTVMHYLHTSHIQLVMLLFVVIVAPVVEEATFRTAVMGFTDLEYGRVSAIVSAVLFAFAHTGFHGSWLNWGQYFFMGLVLAVLYAKTQDWRTNTVTHMLWNLFAVMI